MLCGLILARKFKHILLHSISKIVYALSIVKSRCKIFSLQVTLTAIFSRLRKSQKKIQWNLKKILTKLYRNYWRLSSVICQIHELFVFCDDLLNFQFVLDDIFLARVVLQDWRQNPRAARSLGASWRNSWSF